MLKCKLRLQCKPFLICVPRHAQTTSILLSTEPNRARRPGMNMALPDKLFIKNRLYRKIDFSVIVRKTDMMNTTFGLYLHGTHTHPQKRSWGTHRRGVGQIFSYNRTHIENKMCTFLDYFSRHWPMNTQGPLENPICWSMYRSVVVQEIPL